MTEQTIFLAALDREPAERAAFLDEACAGDATLRRGVETLLRLHGEGHDFLDVPAVEQLAAADTRPGNSETDLSFLAPPSESGSLGRLDHYELLEVVGRGATGIVLRARDTKLERVVAVKALAAPLAASGTARRRFAREARAAAAVRDDHVVAIHAVSDDGPVPYLVMEFIDGYSLEALVRRAGPLEVKDVLRIGLQAASGLAAAHKQGLVHRDVKPANVLLENGVRRVKLTDFGLARAADDASLTQSGYIAGTPLYMSPEQAAGEPLDHRADLFSLGSVLYEMCTGRPAFRAPTIAAVIRRVCDESPRPIREVNPDVPEALCRVIERLHAKKPAERLQSAAEVAELLGRQLAHLQHPGTEPTTELRAPPPARRRIGGGPPGKAASFARRVVACAALVALGLVAASWMGWRADESRPPGTDNREAAAAPSPEPVPIPTPAELARRPAPADALRREDIRAELLQMAGRGDKDQAPPELVAVFGEDRHATGDRRNQLSSVAISPDGKTLAFGGEDTAVRLVSLEGTPGREQAWNQPATENDVVSLAFSPDGKVLACAKGNGLIRLWDVAAGAELRPLAHLGGRVVQINFSPDGKLLAAAADVNGAFVRVWDVATRRPLFTPDTSAVPKAWAVAFSPDGKTLAAGMAPAEVRLWDVGTGKEVARLTGMVGAVRWLGFHPDGQSLVVAGGLTGNNVYVWDLATRKHRLLPGHGSGVVSGAWRADGRLLVTAGVFDGTVRLWDVRGDRPRSLVLPVIPPNVPWLHGIALSPEGRHLAVCNPNGTVYVLRLAKRGEVFEVPGDGVR
jgi:tRNA A-37 threonylcarbamoyl transferase component Bud32